jgi:hypothetical protein
MESIHLGPSSSLYVVEATRLRPGWQLQVVVSGSCQVSGSKDTRLIIYAGRTAVTASTVTSFVVDSSMDDQALTVKVASCLGVGSQPGWESRRQRWPNSFGGGSNTRSASTCSHRGLLISVGVISGSALTVRAAVDCAVCAASGVRKEQAVELRSNDGRQAVHHDIGSASPSELAKADRIIRPGRQMALAYITSIRIGRQLLTDC